MFPGMGGLSPKKMQAMMKQLGMSQEEIEALRVVIEKPDSSNIIIESPSVVKMKIQGQEMFQVSGGKIFESDETSKKNEEGEEPVEKFSKKDIKTVMEKTNATHDQARKVLESTNGDLAEAILELSD